MVTSTASRSKVRVSIPRKKLAELCRRWKVSELALFGSVLRDDFRPDLLDILIAARKALQFVEGINRNEFEDNELIQNAVMRPLEMIGEASAKISKEFRKNHADIPWKEMVGMGNRLIHEYFRVDYGAVWDAIHKDLPNRIEIIEPFVPKEDEIQEPVSMENGFFANT